jgi:hypothetical protein
MAVLLAARSSASAVPTTNAPVDMLKILQELLPQAGKK